MPYDYEPKPTSPLDEQDTQVWIKNWLKWHATQDYTEKR